MNDTHEESRRKLATALGRVGRLERDLKAATKAGMALEAERDLWEVKYHGLKDVHVGCARTASQLEQALKTLGEITKRALDAEKAGSEIARRECEARNRIAQLELEARMDETYADKLLARLRRYEAAHGDHCWPRWACRTVELAVALTIVGAGVWALFLK